MPTRTIDLAASAQANRGLDALVQPPLELLHELDVHRDQLTLQTRLAQQSRIELAEANDRYFELYEVSPLGYLTLDSGGNVLRANLTACTYLEIERRSLIGRSMYEFLTVRDEQALRSALARALDGEPRSSFTVSFAHRLSPTAAARLTLSRTGGAVLVALQDLAEARSLDGTLREREAELSASWEALADGVIGIDRRGRIETCNGAAALLFDRPKQRLIGEHVSRLLPGFPFEATDGRVELTAYVGTRRVPVEVAVRQLTGTRERFVAVVSDISERKRVENARNEALVRFNQTADHIEDAFYTAVATSGESTYMSPAFERIYARPLVAHESEAWPRLAWVHADDRGRVREAVENAYSGQPFDLEYRIVLPNGDVRLVHDRATVLADRDCVAGMVRDITREGALADELRQAQRLEAMGTLASGVAHDFNNLLMGVGGCVQLALRRIGAYSPARGYLRRAAEAIVRGANLTRQILRTGDTRDGTGGPVVLDDVVFGACELVRSIVGDRVQVEVNAAATGVSIDATAGDIEQVLINLASNARDAMPLGGVLTIVTELEGNLVRLAVRDSGSGMSAAVKARVFEPFFTTKPLGEGTGLGLATVFALARRLGGSVGIDSEEGRGTTVSLSLPAVSALPELPAIESRPPESSGETVLIVDDDPLVRLTVESHLDELGYRVLVASRIEEAVAMCKDSSRGIQLALIDVTLKGLAARELPKALEDVGVHVPVLFMSAHAREKLVTDGQLDANARFLPKPFDVLALGEALAAVICEARAVAGEVRQRTLVIDDNIDITDGLKELLELERHDVRVANNAQRALELAPEFEPDVILCDVDLGEDMSGLDLAAELRKHPRLAKTQFFALTGYQPSEYGRRAREVGFEKVLTKPVDPEQLLRTLRARR
jgi:PAS domain S-box-containing protein